MSEISWAHLPNAAVIDELIADAMARHEVLASGWFAAHGVATEPLQSIARIAARGAAELASRSKPQDEAWGAGWEILLAAARYAYRGTAYALSAWDSSADLLALTPDALRTIIETCDGDVKHQAVLLLPAVIARSTP